MTSLIFDMMSENVPFSLDLRWECISVIEMFSKLLHQVAITVLVTIIKLNIMKGPFHVDTVLITQ